uniref:Venom peptide Es3a n=1 Tax=Ectomocoris sp. TaxID=3104572 RepID=A0AB38ZEF8_9HEMI
MDFLKMLFFIALCIMMALGASGQNCIPRGNPCRGNARCCGMNACAGGRCVPTPGK